MPQYPASRHKIITRPSSLSSPWLSPACYGFVTFGCLDEATFSSLIYSQDLVERSTKDHDHSPQEVGSWPAPYSAIQVKKQRRRRVSRNASPLFRGVTTPDLPEGI